MKATKKRASRKGLLVTISDEQRNGNAIFKNVSIRWDIHPVDSGRFTVILFIRNLGTQFLDSFDFRKDGQPEGSPLRSYSGPVRNRETEIIIPRVEEGRYILSFAKR